MFQHINPYGSPTSDGDGQSHLADHERHGAARSGLTSEYHLVTTGTLVSTVAIVSDATVLKGFAMMMV